MIPILLFVYLYDWFSFLQGVVSSNIFLETKFSIQLSSRQFLFEVNRTSIHGEILEKLCASHHASTHISEKSCFQSRQKNPRTCFVNVQVQFFQLEKKMCIIRRPVKINTQNHTPVYFTQKTTIQCKNLCNFQCNFHCNFYGNVELYFQAFVRYVWWRKNKRSSIKLRNNIREADWKEAGE